MLPVRLLCGLLEVYRSGYCAARVLESISEQLVSDPSQRKQTVIEEHRKAQKYLWGNCAKKRPGFIATSVIVIRGNRSNFVLVVP